MESYADRFVVKPGARPKLRKLDPSFTGGSKLEATAKSEIARHCRRLTDLQHRLYAERKHAILVVLQGLDAAGKDGTVIHVMGAFNPEGATVTAFKEPTPEERAHDFLWRVHPHAPAKGTIAVFNRSHYEDVLITRVHKQIGAAACKQRYAAIRAFEDDLAENRTKILKFYLHIDKDEQLRRFAARLDDPSRNWKISDSDYSERRHWNDYVTTYEDAIEATSTKAAPWYIIPSNVKWFRNLAISQIVADAMDGLRMQYPKPSVNLNEIRRLFHSASRGK